LLLFVLQDADGGVSITTLTSKGETKPPQWDDQLAKGDAYNKRHRTFLDVVVAGDYKAKAKTNKNKQTNNNVS
jgi:hypothetical protein